MPMPRAERCARSWEPGARHAPFTCAGRGGRETEIVDQEIDELLAIDLDRARGPFDRLLGAAERVLRVDAGQDFAFALCWRLSWR